MESQPLIKKQPVPFPTDIPGKLARAYQHRDEGNAFFKNGKYGKAKSAYGTSLAFIRGWPGSNRGMDGITSLASKSVSQDRVVTPEQEKCAIELETIVLTNMATCFLKLEDPTSAKMRADEALKLKSDHWKAFLRKAEAEIMLKDSEGAAASLAQSSRYVTEESGRIAIKEIEKKLAALRKKELNQEKLAFGGIFQKNHTKS